MKGHLINHRHFGSYQQSKLSVTQRQGRYSAVKSIQLSWAGCSTHSVYSTVSSLLQNTVNQICEKMSDAS